LPTHTPRPHTLSLRLHRPPPGSPLFPYTTLFRSAQVAGQVGAGELAGVMEGLQIAAAIADDQADAIGHVEARRPGFARGAAGVQDRKSTRLNSSHQIISYAVFCLKKKK